MAYGKRDPRYTREFGTARNRGRRFVSGGKVRIEWTKNGRRRRRTVGPNDAATRREADRMLRDILALHDPAPASDETASVASAASEPGDVLSGLRGVALAMLDLADAIADHLTKTFGGAGR